MPPTPDTIESAAVAGASDGQSALSQIAVCVATYRRPEGLRRLLQALEKVAGPAGAAKLNVQIIVVDNDPQSGQAADVCREFARARWAVQLTGEARRGISYARNTAMRMAFENGADAIAFLDDDEVPEPGWLGELLRVQRASGAEAVCGPVLPQFEVEPARWMVQGKFFERPRFATGAAGAEARTGNLLLASRFLRQAGLWFDERFALSGGEDTLLTLQFQERGGRIAWADDAIVREIVPRERASASYILRRAFFTGCNFARIESLVRRGRWIRARRVAGSLRRIAWNGLWLLPSSLTGRHAAVSRLAEICRGAGQLAGSFGLIHESYRSASARSAVTPTRPPAIPAR